MPQRPLIRSLSATLIAVALASTAWGQGHAPRQAAPAARGADVTLDFVNAEIEAVARTMATITGRNVVVDPRVRGTMSLTSTTPVTPNEALRLFAAQLRTQGFALVENGGIELVLPEAEAKLHSAQVSAGPVRGGSRVETHIFRLKHENALDLVPVLRPLIGANNTINADPSANALVITDYGNNLQRIQSIIAALDVAQATQVEVVELHHSVALDLAPVVERLLDTGNASPVGSPQAGGRGRPVTPANTGGSGGGFHTVIVAEPSSNAIIVRAANNAKLSEAVALIERLDQRAGELAARGSNIHVVYLKNADAAKLAVTLRATLAAMPGYNAGGDLGNNVNAATTQQIQPVNSQPVMSAQQNGTSTGLDSGPAINAQANNQPTTGGQIQADTSTNALIINAPEPIYRELRAAIDKLDQRRAQVYVESLIAEVRTDKMAQFGIQWQGVLGHNGDRNIGVLGTNFGTVGNILGLGPAVNGLVTNGQIDTSNPNASIGQGANLAWLHRFGPGYLLSALANFIQTSGTGNVLSTPTLLTLDNEEARIVVGQNVPLVTGSYANTGVGNNVINPFQTYERQDVGLTLRIRPQISEDGTIKMVIYQETSDVDPNSINSPQGIITNKRAIESSVLVNDGQVVVLGGLIQDQYTDSKSKVPLLGDLPLVGNLFRSESRSHKRTNLMVFLRPVVVRDAAATEGYSLSRYDYLRASQEITQPTPNLVLPVNDSPMLPQIQPVDPAALAHPAPTPLTGNDTFMSPAALEASKPSAPAFEMPAAGGG